MNCDLPNNDRVAIAIADDGVATVRLTRADKLNALDLPMIDAIARAGSALHERADVRAVVLAGDGRAFCAGIDLAALGGLLASDAPRLAERTHGNANAFQQAAMVWRKLPVPVIAAVQGVCFGGGLQIAGGADIRVVAPDARLAVMELRWGIVPDMGGFVLWRGVVRDDVLRELTYTNREFSGEEAHALGFATMLDSDPLARAQAIAGEIARRNPGAIREAKALFNHSAELGTDAVLIEESHAQQRLMGSRNQLEAVQSQMERREPVFVDP